MYMSVCKTAEEEGIFVLHGNRGSFHTEKQPAFKAVYTSIEQVNKLVISYMSHMTHNFLFIL